jgi:aminocarboxymuconate-semialdehyde decarboxylase
MSSGRSVNIDFHAHVIPPAYLDLARAGRVPELRVERTAGGEALDVIGGSDGGPVAQRIPLTPAWLDVGVRVAEMEAAGVDVQVLSVVQFMYHYWLDVERAAALARVSNDGIAAMVAADPMRFAGMATVPLQDADAAVEELRRARGELGLRAVEIGTHINGMPLDGRALAPFWAAAEALHVVVFVHPYAPLGRDRLAAYFLRNLLGNPFETAVAAARLIFGGVLERHPRLRLCLAHGGGALPAVIGRLEHGYEVSESCRAHGAGHPASYFQRFWYDTITHDPAALDCLVARVGASQVLLGSDYPFAIGDLDPVRTVEKLGVDRAAREAILGGNAAALLGLA